MPDTDVFDFDEAVALMHIGASGFKFRNSRGGIFTTEIDTATWAVPVRIITPIKAEETKETT